MNKMRQWSMLTAVAVVVVLAAGWFLGVSPQRAKATTVRAQVATQQSQNSALQVEVNQLKHMKLGLPAQQRRLAKIAERIPDNPALPVLIRQLSAAADRAGVELVSMSPSAPAAVTITAPTPTSPTTTSPTAGATPAAPATTLEKIQISLNVTGGYYNIESFFTAIEHLSRAMMVTQWTLAPGAAPSASSGSTSTSGTSSTAGSSSSSTLPDTLSGTLTAQVFESPQITAPTAAAAS